MYNIFPSTQQYYAAFTFFVCKTKNCKTICTVVLELRPEDDS